MSLKRIRVLFLTLTTAAFCPPLWADGPFQLYTIVPCRLVDTRDSPSVNGGGPALQNGAIRSFAVLGSNSRPCGIPADGTVKAVVINITAVAPSSYGHVTLWPYGGAIPPTSNVNFGVGETAIGNGAVIPIGSSLTWQLSAYAALGDAGQTGLVLDITGYFK